MATSPCKPCEGVNQFQLLPQPGVPVGRFVTPLVRVNAQVQDMKPGMKIPAEYLDIEGIRAALAETPQPPAGG